MKYNTINNRECLSLPEYKIKHNDSNKNNDTISHDNTINHDDTLVLKVYFNSHQIKYSKEIQNVKDAFLKILSNIEQNFEKNLKKK